MLFGMPYKGSKSRYVVEFLDNFGTGEVFYDVFGGGGAVTHAIADRFKQVVYNDSNQRVSKAFERFASGDVGELPFVSCADFKVRSKCDGIIGLCYSFGTGLRTYGYGQDIEPWKQALHYYLLEDDPSMFEDMGIKIKGRLTAEDIEKNFDLIRSRYEEWFREMFRDSFTQEQLDSKMRTMRTRSVSSFAQAEHVKRFRRMSQLKDSPLTNVKVLCCDYRDIKIEEGSVVYCDPPYEDTEQYENTGYKQATFRKDLFVEWCRKMRGVCDVFVSEQTMPDDFEIVWEKKVRNMFNGQKKKNDRIERLFRLK